MKRFQFKFNPILKHRKAREDEAMRALGDAQRAHQAALQVKAGLLRELQQSLERRERMGGGGELEILALRTEQEFIDGTKQRIVQSDQAIVRASRNLERAMRAYLHARRQTRMMETLYDRHYLEYKRDRAKKEQRELDDLSVMRNRLSDSDADSAESSDDGREGSA